MGSIPKIPERGGTQHSNQLTLAHLSVDTRTGWQKFNIQNKLYISSAILCRPHTYISCYIKSLLNRITTLAWARNLFYCAPFWKYQKARIWISQICPTRSKVKFLDFRNLRWTGVRFRNKGRVGEGGGGEGIYSNLQLGPLGSSAPTHPRA